MNKLLPACAGVVLALLITACTGTPTLEEKPSSEFPGLNKVSHSGFREAWARPGANLPGYRSILISTLRSDRAQVIQPASSSRIRRDWEMTPERQQTLSRAWDDSMRKAARKRGLDSSGQGEQVLRIDAELTRIAPSANLAETDRAAGRTRVYTENSGDAAVEFRLYDQASGQLLVVIRDQRSIGPDMWGQANTVTASADVRNLLNNWSNTLLSRVTGNQESQP